jgi:hypothetical protein
MYGRPRIFNHRIIEAKADFRRQGDPIDQQLGDAIWRGG